MRKLRVGVIFGGRSGEHEVSLVSAASIMQAVDRTKYEVVPIGITKDGEWLVAGDPMRMLQERALSKAHLPQRTTAQSRALARVVGGQVHALRKLDVVFPVLHGTYGEDGTIQGLLELANIPYVGAGVAASALGMDKALMKTVFRQHGLPVADFQVILRKKWEQHPEAIIAQVEAKFSYPCFVKPTNLGSSVGVSKAHSRPELIKALNEAARFDRKMLVEEALEGREIECSILGNDEPRASIVGEIVPQREFYDYEAKYLDDRTQLLIPADLPPETTAKVQELAVRAFIALDCAGMARVDFFLARRNGNIYINELNTIPGFTSISMYPKLWEASGIEYTELISRLIQLALERHADKIRNRTSFDGQRRYGQEP